MSSPVQSPTGRFLNDSDHDMIGDADRDNTRDNDNDAREDYVRDDNGEYHDRDDLAGLTFGQPASATEASVVVSVIERYLQVARRTDARTACTMLMAPLERSIRQDYGRGSAGPAYLQAGTDCLSLIPLLFKHFRAQLRAPVAVTGVRVNGRLAMALLGSQSMPASSLSLRNEDGSWKIAQLFPAPLG